MAIIILPDAQDDLLSLQEYMLDKWSEADWRKAEDEFFDKRQKSTPTVSMERQYMNLFRLVFWTT